MFTKARHLPNEFKGDWCDVESARQYRDQPGPADDELGVGFLRTAWAEALLQGDLKAAHKHWGKLKGFTGSDPWEDNAWRAFREAQQLGERIWDDFDASKHHDRVVMKTFMSYWSGPKAGA